VEWGGDEVEMIGRKGLVLKMNNGCLAIHMSVGLGQ